MIQILLLLTLVVPAILFIRTQQHTLQAIQPMHREMTPAWVWLQLIPILGQIWQFFVVTRISNSLRKEFESKLEGSILSDSNDKFEQVDGRPTFNIGIAYCILITAGEIINVSSRHWLHYWPLIGSVLSLAGLICWVNYWVLLAKHKARLIKMSFNVA